MNREQAQLLLAELETAVWNVAFYENSDPEGKEQLSYWRGRLESLRLVDDITNFTGIAEG